MTGFFKSFAYAWTGIRVGARGRNFRVMVAVAVAVAGFGVWLGLTTLEWAAVLICCGLVLGLELLNTAGERLVDILSPDHDPLYGRVKDLLAGAVLLAALASLGVGLVIFWPKLF